MPRIADTNFHRDPSKAAQDYINYIERAVTSKKINPEEKDLIHLFVSEAGAIRQITFQRKFQIAFALITFREHIQDYHTCTTPGVFVAIENYRSCSGYAPNTQAVTLIICKRFLLWLHESGYNTSLNPSKISKLRITSFPPLKTADDILTSQELQQLLSATKNLRDRALLEVLYDSMGRVGEVTLLKWGQVTFHGTYATVTLDSKTGVPRKVPLYTSHVALKQWMACFPSGATPEKYIFQARGSNGAKSLTYMGVLRIVQVAKTAAGITKNVTPQIFRHTRITDLMRMGVAEQTIKMLAWGTVATDMLRVYAHLTPTDAENDLNRMMGITSNDNKIAALADIATPVQCKKCGLVNPKSEPFCVECGHALSDEFKDDHATILKFLSNGAGIEKLKSILESELAE